LVKPVHATAVEIVPETVEIIIEPITHKIKAAIVPIIKIINAIKAVTVA
jgi:hypothetical protein